VRVLPNLITKQEKIENVLVRQGFRRSNHMIAPGLYAVGRPDENSEVLVTANYKLSVDALREHIDFNAWILVLDTHGINVWCAAGKGTFSTEELIKKIAKSRLNRIVNHKRMILPQLGAPGVSGYIVTAKTGFKVIYGPVRPEDLKTFIDQNCKANSNMRRVQFSLQDRLLLTPLEFIQSIRYSAVAFVMILLMALSGKYSLEDTQVAVQFGLWMFFATVMGTGVFPLALPKLRGKMFTTKALPLSLIWSVAALLSLTKYSVSIFECLGFMFMGSSLIELFALNFTGATPITSYSETKDETLKVMPLIVGSFLLGALVFGLAVWKVI